MIFILYFVTVQAYKVAIIGCGIGGATLATLVPHTIYEASYQCGGRINHVLVPGMDAIELGATFFIKQNEYVKNQAEKRNLKYYKRNLGKFGVLRNKELVMQTSESNVIDFVKMVYNYGMSPKTVKEIADDALENFMNIYKFLESGKYYKDLNEFLEIIKLHDETMNFTSFLHEFGVNQNFQNDFVDSILLSIYNQKSVNTISGVMGIIAAFNDAYSITGGNRQLIDESQLNVVYSKVESIKRLQNGKYLIQNEQYDYVAVSNLLNLDISFDNIQTINNFQYQNNKETYVYIVAGKIGKKYFGKYIDDLDTVVVQGDPDLSEIRLECKKCYQGWNVYKVQGIQQLNLGNIFESYQTIYEKVWVDAYPLFQEASNNRQFEFEKNFFYLNSMENLASCMELQMIQAKNIANIILSREKILNEDL